MTKLNIDKMNGLPFPSVKYRQYKNTFLTRVLLSMDCSALSVVSDKVLLSRLKDFAEAYFQVKMTDLSGPFKNVKLTKDDGTQIFLLSKQSAAVMLDGAKYVSYTDTAQPQLEKLCDYMEKVVDAKTVQRVEIRKINMWQFKNESGIPFSAEEARRFVLQEEIRDLLSADNLLDEERVISGMVKKEWTDGGDSLVLRSAYLPDAKVQGVSRLVLDTARVTDGIVPVKEIPTVVKEMNTDLYNAYFGCVNSEIVRIMEDEQHGAE